MWLKVNTRKGTIAVILCAVVIIIYTVYWTQNLSTNSIQSAVFIPEASDLSFDVEKRREFIKLMMKDAWDDYVRYAWGANELKPLSRTWRYGDIYGYKNIGATIIDALDTLFIMGLKEEFSMGRDWVDASFDISKKGWIPWNQKVSLFEINIRIIGGLLSAYALTGDALFANKAYQVGKKVLPAFDTPSGIPFKRINPATGETDRSKVISLAALGSLHLEFIYLSEVTGDPVFAQKVTKIRENMQRIDKPKGLYPSMVSTTTGKFDSGLVTLGAGSDSFYEYLLKSWIQTGDVQSRQMYDEAMDALIKKLMFTSKPSNLLYFGEYVEGTIYHEFSHLACFSGGMFALGAATDPTKSKAPVNTAEGGTSVDGARKERDMSIGRNLTHTCRESYARSKTRIGPEIFYFDSGVEALGFDDKDKKYILRPEVIESYLIMYRLTKDEKYRDWGWEAALAIQKYCKAGPGRGYSGIKDVYSDEPEQDDIQQTFFLAETLKYLYLLFSPTDLIDLDSWVFNTESHPLPIKGQNPMFNRNINVTFLI